VLVAALVLSPAPAPEGPAPAPAPFVPSRRVETLLGVGTAAALVGFAGLVVGLIGVERRGYGVCAEPSDDPDEPVPPPSGRCFDEPSFARKHANANTTMIVGLSVGGGLVLGAAALITSGLVLRDRTGRSPRRVVLDPGHGGVGVRF
jgi:hypothetical protein